MTIIADVKKNNKLDGKSFDRRIPSQSTRLSPCLPPAQPVLVAQFQVPAYRPPSLPLIPSLVRISLSHVSYPLPPNRPPTAPATPFYPTSKHSRSL
ncbi:unnamed protein product [Ectocarpus sp. CCAP 1310/34]|nr:unnamed protein product [Ectocarpus sp. CCAP 1310/34]